MKTMYDKKKIRFYVLEWLLCNETLKWRLQFAWVHPERAVVFRILNFVKSAFLSLSLCKREGRGGELRRNKTVITIILILFGLRLLGVAWNRDRPPRERKTNEFCFLRLLMVDDLNSPSDYQWVNSWWRVRLTSAERPPPPPYYDSEWPAEKVLLVFAVVFIEYRKRENEEKHVGD